MAAKSADSGSWRGSAEANSRPRARDAVGSGGACRSTDWASRLAPARGARQVAARAASVAHHPHLGLTGLELTQQVYRHTYSLQGGVCMTRMAVFTLLTVLPAGGGAPRGGLSIPGTEHAAPPPPRPGGGTAPHPGRPPPGGGFSTAGVGGGPGGPLVGAK